MFYIDKMITIIIIGLPTNTPRPWNNGPLRKYHITFDYRFQIYATTQMIWIIISFSIIWYYGIIIIIAATLSTFCQVNMKRIANPQYTYLMNEIFTVIINPLPKKFCAHDTLQINFRTVGHPFNQTYRLTHIFQN